MFEMIDVTDAAGAVVQPAWLLRAEAVHRQLRPQLAPDYSAALQPVFDNGGRLLLAASGENVLGLAVWRRLHFTHSGAHLYVEDLVTDEQHRSSGVGRALLDTLETRARGEGLATLTLDSGLQRAAAHRFYFREGYAVTSFHFAKTLR